MSRNVVPENVYRHFYRVSCVIWKHITTIARSSFTSAFSKVDFRHSVVRLTLPARRFYHIPYAKESVMCRMV